MLEKLLGCEALISVFSEALANEILEFFGPLRLEWRNVFVEYLQQHLLLVRAVSVWWLSISKLKGIDTVRPDIDTGGVFLLSLDQLRGHP